MLDWATLYVGRELLLNDGIIEDSGGGLIQSELSYSPNPTHFFKI